MVSLSAAVLDRYERFSRYNSPYAAHDAGCAIDLYPGTDGAVSPVAGTVRSIRTVRCPDRPYAASEDHLLLIDCGSHVARILHVDPDVEVGERIDVGDRLGALLRSGFFGRWVDTHLHLGFRQPEQNLNRANGSLPIGLDASVTGLEWDGRGTIVEAGRSYVRLDSPSGRGRRGFTALADDDGVGLDGGLAHYRGGGTFATAEGERSLLGTPIGTADGREIEWADVAVFAADRRATGLSLFASQVPFGAKLVFRGGHGFEVGDDITVSIEPTADPIRLS
ncbi:peptidase M23 family protein [Natronomonas moolapensis 8.8.11]|uniref:Peptidase M23 family protein n=1 Tax=Natronomonas moolapensis (strain DSM 18674 / CECT 7526 / JCM 14361 / 8.8.11) TaxID=268739 RepID=M1XQA0_NATM8|nr:hypothetical protein [Natronomonas moolapensis]CCQ36293.1 peptidase M23 family protein [Natronomonas moolapensis 8.8.11]